MFNDENIVHYSMTIYLKIKHIIEGKIQQFQMFLKALIKEIISIKFSSVANGTYIFYKNSKNICSVVCNQRRNRVGKMELTNF